MMIARTHEKPIIIDSEMLQSRKYIGMDFHRCILDELNFSGVDMTAADLRSAEMNRTILNSTLFCKAKLIMVKAHSAIMDECNFEEALIFYSDFNGSSLIKSDFSKCMLNKVAFTNCDIRGANFNCSGLETCDFTDAIYDELTIWNETFNVADVKGIKLHR